MTRTSTPRNSAEVDSRLNQSAATRVSRASRTSADESRAAPAQDKILTAEERRRLLREEAVTEILPRLPEIPGFHLCWLTTTNPSDPIFRRIKLGYTPVKAEEVEGYDYYRKSGGDYDGVVACNEMLLFKIPQQTYIDLMTIYHHDMPNEEEAAIREKLRQSVQTDSQGEAVGIAEEGSFTELGAPKPAIFH